MALLHEDATFTMPPYPLWLRGREQVRAWLLGKGIGCRGSRVLQVAANGGPAFGTYRPAGPGHSRAVRAGRDEGRGRKVSGLHHYLYPELFPAFGLPERLES